MNVLNAEVLNILHSRGKDDWTVSEILTAIESRREDVSNPPSKRDIQRATMSLYEQGKATRRRTGGSTSPLIYTAAIPDLIRGDGLIALVTELLTRIGYKWTVAIFLPLGLGVVSLVRGIMGIIMGVFG